MLPPITICVTPSTIKLLSVTYNIAEMYNYKPKCSLSQADCIIVAVWTVSKMGQLSEKGKGKINGFAQFLI